MKNFLNISVKSIRTYGLLSLGLLLASACGTYEYAGVSDGVYGEPVVYNTPTNTYPSKVVERNEGGEDSGSFYKNYFAEKSNQYRINMNAVDTTANPEVFTDIDGYSSANFEGDNLNFGSESYTYSEGYGGWGDETESVVINYYNNYTPFYGYGAGYWGGFGYPYYGGFGYGFGYPYRGYGYGYGYRPYYGYARPYYGYGFGYGYPRYGFGFGYGGFGFSYYNAYNPYYYGGGFGHSRSHVAYNSSRRGSVSRVNSTRGVVSENNGRSTSRRGSSVTNSTGRRVSDVRNTSYYRNRVSADGNSNSRIRSQAGTRGTNGRGTVSTTSNIRSTAYYSRRVNTSTRGDVNGRLNSRGTGDIRSGNGSRGRSDYTGSRTGVLTRSSSGVRSRGSNGAVRSTGGSRSSGGAIRSSGGGRSSGGAIRSSGGGRSSGGAIRSGGGGGRSGGAIRSSGGRGGSN